MSSTSTRSDISSALRAEASRGLRLWLVLSIGLLTLALLAWVGIGNSDMISSTSRVVTSILENRSNTFSEMFVQRDLEQYLSSKNAGVLTPVSLTVQRGERSIAQVGAASWFGISRSFSVPTVTSIAPYVVSISLDLRPVLVFYLLFVGGILITYHWMLKYSLASFNRSVTAISNEFVEIIRELRGDPKSKQSSSLHPLQEVAEIRQLSESWKLQLEQYREEVSKLSSAEAESKLAQQVAHDIKSPLSVFRIVLARKNPIGEEERSVLVKASDRISGIAEDMLALAKNSLERSQLKGEKGKLPMSELKDIWLELAKQKKIEYPALDVEFNFISDEPKEYEVPIGDVTKLKRIISNLMNNSLNASAKRAALTLGLVATSNATEISISDDGPGISPEVLSRLSEIPYSTTGTGMGVSSAFRWMREQGGEVKIASELGQGTTVTLAWPKPKALATVTEP